MSRAYFESSCSQFLEAHPDQILGALAGSHGHALEMQQRYAWEQQIAHLQDVLQGFGEGHILFEYTIPRMGKRADVILLARGAVWVLEYKVGSTTYDRHSLDQVVDYALDLKNFHEQSHHLPIIPVLVATNAPSFSDPVVWEADQVAYPIRANSSNLGNILESSAIPFDTQISFQDWSQSGYRPTPTIIEAAKALYGGHSVEEISRSDAGAINLTRTAQAISEAIEMAKSERKKVICFVTGVPGSGKTLAGLNLIHQRQRLDQEENAVFLSGNGPLVKVLREALIRDEMTRPDDTGQTPTRSEAELKVVPFIQNIHHFRDDCLQSSAPPIEQVVVFDEAQRAWDRAMTSRFMKNKRGQADFDMSEPEFLLSVMDRHKDWCVVVCLIGNGQEINTGEAGIQEWIDALGRSYPDWMVWCSDRIPEFSNSFDSIGARTNSGLHLAVNIRSFRSERVSAFVGQVIQGDDQKARTEFAHLDRYPIVMTRNVDEARQWLKKQARGTERYGLVASSNALRLKPEGIFMKSAIDPAYWFLNAREDVRSSYAMEDVASEFDIQGLELDWVGVCWDANFRRDNGDWGCHAFRGSKWMNIRNESKQQFLANAYRVLLTRARQGMVIVVPHGDYEDATRPPRFYDETYSYLQDCGIPVLN